MIRVLRALFLALIMIQGAWCHAEARTIRIIGRGDATVTTPHIKLEDIAEVVSERVQDDEAVIGLKKIWIAQSPEPLQTVSISAQEVLGKINDQGVDLNAVGYTLPRVISVKRAGRNLPEQEILQAISDYIDSEKKSLGIKKLITVGLTAVGTGTTTIRVEDDAPAEQGKHYFTLIAEEEAGFQKRFPVSALVDEFRDMPVAKRSLAKGSVVTAADVMMARFNTALLPRDVAEQSENIVGLETTNDISAGEVFRNAKLALPVLVAAGSPVTLQYKTDRFEATATGIALEAGAAGQEIRVRNESSKKIVPGIVSEEGIVRVK